MRKTANLNLLASTILCFFLFSAHLNGQGYRFRNYGLESGIPDLFISTLNQDRNGYLWIGSGSGLSKFDGINFFKMSFPDSVVGRYPTVSLRDKAGRIWFGCSDGSVFYTEGTTLQPSGLNKLRSVSISSMIESPDGSLFIIPQGKSVFKIDPSDPDVVTEYAVDEQLSMLSACFTQSGNLLIGTQEDLRIFEVGRDSLLNISTMSGFDYSSILAIHKIRDKDIYLAGTNGSGLFRLEISGKKNTISRLPGTEELNYESIPSITEDDQGNILLSTNESGFVEMKLSEDANSVKKLSFFSNKSGLPGNNIRFVFQDNEGNLWIGLFGNGLSLLNSLAFSYYSPGSTQETNNIIYANKLNNDYFLGTPSGFYLFDTANIKKRSFTDLRQKTGRIEIASYFVDGENNVWIGTRGGGLFKMTPDGSVRQFFRSGNSAEDYINDVKCSDKYIWLGTLNGVIILNRFSGFPIAVYNTNNGLPHNSISQIFITSEGKAAVATEADRLYLIDLEKGVTAGKAVMYGTTMNKISSFCQSKSGSLWASTLGNGVFEFFGDSLKSFTRNDLLISDYAYGILADTSDRIWIGHDRGFSRYNLKTGILKTFGTEFAGGGGCNPAGMYESPDGKVFIGTTTGFIVYDKAKDYRPQLPPVNNINSITVNDKEYPYSPSLTLPYNKRYTIRVDYIGINLRDAEKVWYQTKIDNLDDSWSSLTTSRSILFAPRDGKYKFNMKSVNEDGLSQETPVSFNLVIKKPIWRTGWFLLLMTGVISGIVILIVRQREKEQKKIQEYLEKELEARTSVVMKQKGEIELANLEITDSINYAKRIQSSILPDFGKLKETFSDAFLIFRPRDIVSGDFYWFDKLDEERFMVVCADSTGHGVPGAFMSMIGSTLLQDIVKRQNITKPSGILKMLDNHIFSTLNQNVELGVSNDGMDMVVCEINVKTRYIRFASAMRPVILVLDGEPFYIKGNRSSVGGESVIEKFFDDQEYYLNKGDTIYLFSDGLPDQFGGVDGKKMKIARLKKLIEDVTVLPMAGQKDVITKFYDEWKGDYEQVDDILMMGVRL
jgi:ligand-binding sensor domain-containing protein/serine phosphatase RsbU (regulator of sigma subunit)